ncbi:MAG: c-type cytochrome [Fidelibacterota bacterium]
MNNILKRILSILLIMVSITITGCMRGQRSKKPPVHLNPNMDTQEKYKPYRMSPLFSDGASMRLPVPGTVARGSLHDDDPVYTGKDAKGGPVKTSLVPFTKSLLLRGQERYNIYCAVCHGGLGDGRGIITQYKFPLPPTSFLTEQGRAFTDGHFFDVITNGIRNMPAYKYQIPVQDRWAIIGYIRALQKSQHAAPGEVPGKIRATLTDQ